MSDNTDAKDETESGALPCKWEKAYRELIDTIEWKMAMCRKYPNSNGYAYGQVLDTAKRLMPAPEQSPGVSP